MFQFKANLEATLTPSDIYDPKLTSNLPDYTSTYQKPQSSKTDSSEILQDLKEMLAIIHCSKKVTHREKIQNLKTDTALKTEAASVKHRRGIERQELHNCHLRRI